MLRLKYKESEVHYYIVLLFIFSLFMQGPLVAISKGIGLGATMSFGTLLTYQFYPYFIYYLLISINKVPVNKFYVIFIFLLLLFSVSMFAKILLLADELEVYSIRRMINYCLPITLVFISMHFKKKQNIGMIKFIVLLGVICAVIGLVQFLGGDSLPKFLTDIPVLEGEAGFGGLYIEDLFIIKPNGLVGNTIEFGVFLNIILSLNLFIYSSSQKFTDKLKLYLYSIIIIACNFLVLSRFSLVMSIIVLLIYFFSRLKIIKFSLLLIVFFTVLILSTWIIYQSSSNTSVLKFTIDRIIGSDNTTASASNDIHQEDFTRAMLMSIENPIIGSQIGIGKKVRVVSDGAFPMMLVEFGFPLFCIFLLLFSFPVLCLSKWFLNIKNFQYKFMLACFFVVFLANFLNSAFFNKFTYSLYWLICGSSWTFYQGQILERGKNVTN